MTVSGGRSIEVRLSRDMSLLDVTMIGIGAMIGAGIFVLTGIAAGVAGPALVLVFLLNGFVTTITAMAYAELGSCFPEAGGGYLWVKQGLPGPNGFLSGWMSWFAHSVACSLYALGFGAYFNQVLVELGISLAGIDPHIAAKVLAAGICLVFAGINFVGSSETGKAETVVTVAKIVVLLLFVGSGLWVMATSPGWQSHFRPFMPKGFEGVFVGMALTFIAFEGYEIIAQCGEEVREPRRNIPRAVFLSLGIVVIIYVLVALVALGALRTPAGVLSWQYLAEKKELAMVEAARDFMLGGGRWGAALLLVGGLFSTMSALNATIYSSSRVSFAMGRDHNLPSVFAKVHPKRHTPHGALLISSVLVILMAAALPIEDVASACDIMFLLLFLQVNVVLIALRQKYPDMKRGFKVPLFPWLPLVGVVANLALAGVLFTYSPIAWYVTTGWILVGLAFYYGYAQEVEQKAEGSRVVAEKVPVARRSYRVLVAVANPEHVSSLVQIAAAVARQHDGEVVALSVVAVPDTLPLREGRKLLHRSEHVLNLAQRAGEKLGVEVAIVARIGHSVSKAILETIAEEKPALLVMGWRGWTQTSKRVLGTTLDPVLSSAPCNVALLKVMNDLSQLRHILVGVTASPHSDLAIEIAHALSDCYEAQVTYLHVVKQGTPMDKRVQRRYRETLEGAGASGEVPRLQVVEDKSTAVGLVKASADKDLVIIGAAREHPLRQILFGTKAHAVAKLSRASVLLVKCAPKRWVAVLQETFGPVEQAPPEELMELGKELEGEQQDESDGRAREKEVF